MKNILFNLIIMVLLLGCSDTNSPVIDDKLIGVWNQKEYLDGNKILYRAPDFKSDEYGIKILPNNKIIERKNSGWCGTPPISYSNFEGTWTKLNDNLYEIEVEFWGGVTKYKIEIISVNQTELTIKYHYEDAN